VSADSDDDTAAGAAFAFSPRFGGMLNMCGQRERELIREVRIGLVAFMRYTFGRQCRLLFAQSLYAEAAGRALAFLQQQGALIMQRQDNLARAWANDAPSPLAYGVDPLPGGTNPLHAQSSRGCPMVRECPSRLAVFDPQARPCPMAPSFAAGYRPPFFAQQDDG